MTFTETQQWLTAKYKGSNVDDLKKLRESIGVTLKEIKKEKSSVFERFKGIHGRFQHSQLDVLDIREIKTCAVIDDIDNMIAAHHSNPHE